MSDDSPQNAQRVRDLISKIEIARAADLAYRNHFEESETILAGVLRSDEQPHQALDLLARIRAHQGRFQEAQSLWNRAVVADPANQSYRLALTRISEINQRQIRSRVAPIFLVSGVGVVLLVALGYAAFRLAYQREVSNEIGDTNPRIESSSKMDANGDGSPLKINIKSATVKSDVEGLNIVFDFGLFPRGTELSPKAMATLDSLGQQLRTVIDSNIINVQGHTSATRLRSTGKFQDNAALGLARAVAVIEYLRSSQQLPAKTFIATTSGETESPYPNDSRENRLRNQTVTIRITSKR
ncbi:MAG TPA: OmpA family protein [Pyrinomonadaceae bacterium]|nr:OmpA family protein [Pyrinomonadaceae bacterium]